jgi:hypothetical protein
MQPFINSRMIREIKEGIVQVEVKASQATSLNLRSLEGLAIVVIVLGILKQIVQIRTKIMART